ncbi:hypothetical protein DJ533_09905 [Acinetobacter defluvii]|uniref:Uncharacterized protein n=1 Tax=Acinetobacter defluvii TaxID=1871111 RepID=A0A2S2FD45_9GAMM|nr:hypothetical protein [Acinetobacter defluvii]AWL28859.1 hypothetical protein DJ533_09905 [Acinetobacter defluvii]
MSKLGCECGYVIRDNTDDLPHKASFIPDKLDYQMLDEIKTRIENYKEKLNLGEKVYDDYLFDLISTVDLKFRKDIYECINCGRLWLQTASGNFISYLSETGKYEAILDVDN